MSKKYIKNSNRKDYEKNEVNCNETTGVCFAEKHGVCTILTANYEDGHCPFRKEKRQVTNGKYYPYISPNGKGSIDAAC